MMQKDRALSLLIAMESALEDDRFEVGLHHLCDVGSATMTEYLLSSQGAMQVHAKSCEPASLCWHGGAE